MFKKSFKQRMTIINLAQTESDPSKEKMYDRFVVFFFIFMLVYRNHIKYMSMNTIHTPSITYIELSILVLLYLRQSFELVQDSCKTNFAQSNYSIVYSPELKFKTFIYLFYIYYQRFQ